MTNQAKACQLQLTAQQLVMMICNDALQCKSISYCFAWACITLEHALFYPRNFVDLQAMLKLSYLGSGSTDHCCAYTKKVIQSEGLCIRQS